MLNASFAQTHSSKNAAAYKKSKESDSLLKSAHKKLPKKIKLEDYEKIEVYVPTDTENNPNITIRFFDNTDDASDRIFDSLNDNFTTERFLCYANGVSNEKNETRIAVIGNVKTRILQIKEKASTYVQEHPPSCLSCLQKPKKYRKFQIIDEQIQETT